MLDSTIRVSYVNEITEHVHAARVYDARQPLARLNKIAAAVLVLFSGWLLYAAGPQVWSAVFLVLAVLEWFDALSIRPLQVYLAFRWNPKFLERYEIEFSESGLHFRTDSIDSSMDWSFYKSVIESSRVFMLVYGRMAYSVIPKRAFSGPGEVEAFRELARRHIEA